MKATKLLLSIVLLVWLSGCGQSGSSDESADAPETDATTSSNEEINGLSIYQLASTWNTQSGGEIEFKDLEGEVLVVVMIYTSCKSACPRLVADMKEIESTISASEPDGVRYVLVSIDPKHDTPERLKAFAIENEMTGPQWLFLQGNEESVREFANVTAVRYTQISPLDFSHSNIISVFDRNGVMKHQQEGLEVDYQGTINTVLSLAANEAGPVSKR